MPRLDTQFAHLGRNATATVEPPFNGMEWYEGYDQRHAADGNEGRLVAQHSFTQSWTAWEVHPVGAELVICTAGELTLIQERPDGGTDTIHLTAGEYAINPPGIWHTADVAPGVTATAIFITAGEGTDHRPR